MSIGPFEGARTRHINRKGRTISLSRPGEEVSVGLLGFFNIWTAEEMVGTDLRQGDVRVDVLASQLTGYPNPPRNPDLITADGVAYTVLFCNPIYEAEKLIGYTMAARGA